MCNYVYIMIYILYCICSLWGWGPFVCSRSPFLPAGMLVRAQRTLTKSPCGHRVIAPFTCSAKTDRNLTTAPKGKDIGRNFGYVFL